jgi:nucleoside-diphosphate-sugar epimerase
LSGNPERDPNVRSLINGLEWLRRMPQLSCRRFVTVGSCFEYELTGERLSERSPLGPHDLYGACKRSLFEVATQYAATAGLTVVCPRVFYTYGPYEDRRRLVPSVVLAVLRGAVAGVTPGQQVRDYLHVEDVAAGIWAAAQSDVTGAVNIASGEALSVAALAMKIGALLGRPELIQLGALAYRDDEPMHILGDPAVLRDRLGWAPRFDLDRGLVQTIDWWRRCERLAS